MFIAVSIVTLHQVIGLGEIIYVKHLGRDRHSVSMEKTTAISSKASQCNQPILGRRELRHEKLSYMPKASLRLVVKALEHTLTRVSQPQHI